MSVLVVDDEEPFRLLIERRLASSRHHVECAASGEAALDRLSDRTFDVVLLDLRMPGIGGIETLVPKGQALDTAVHLAHELAGLPQRCLRSDRLSAYEQWSLSYTDAMRNELRRGLEVVESGETHAGAHAFAGGQGRHGAVRR
jgi:DNA-binding NtrC family response regulator